ncbi:hypothetical protein [Kutzneria sp. NPDC052558]|uniref:hypothetical protein n=1 Tax=Kutzneria sp. NPDC052558 TaxID=3364121 RepID=UPI0037C73647
MTASIQVAHFATAARRHYADGDHLFSMQRYASADHLAGFAAECALKVILLQFLGATLVKGKPVSVIGGGQKVPHSHLPPLWDNLPLVASGRGGASFVALMTKPNPFVGWAVDDRYSDGKHIDPVQVRAHLDAAKQIIAIQQQAQIAGALP